MIQITLMPIYCCTFFFPMLKSVPIVFSYSSPKSMKCHNTLHHNATFAKISNFSLSAILQTSDHSSPIKLSLAVISKINPGDNIVWLYPGLYS